MAMDWLAGLGAQDASMEGMLAKRDLSKQLNMIMAIAKEKADQSQFQQRQGLDERQLEAQVAATTAQRDAIKQYREQTDKEQAGRERRGRYDTVQGNLKPGDRIDKGGEFHQSAGEFGTGDQFTPDANDPGKMIYQKLAFEQAQLKLKADQEHAKVVEQRAQRDQQLQEKANARAEKSAADMAKTREMTRAKTQQSIEKANKASEGLRPEYRMAANKTAADRIKNEEASWMESITGDTEAVQARKATIAYDEVNRARQKQAEDDARKLGKGPLATSAVGSAPQPQRVYYDANGNQIKK